MAAPRNAFSVWCVVLLSGGTAACQSCDSARSRAPATSAAPVTAAPSPGAPGASRTPLEAMSGDDPGRCLNDVIVDGNSLCFEFNRDYYWCRGGGREQSIMLDSGTAAQKRRHNAGEYNVIPYHFNRLYFGGNKGCGLLGRAEVYCWGYDLGSISAQKGVLREPVRMAHLPTPFDDFDLAELDYCARKGDDIWCNRVNSRSLWRVTGLGQNIRWMRGGGSPWCAANDREVWCWSSYFSWARSIPDAGHTAKTLPAHSITLPEGLRIQSLQLGLDHACILGENGGVYCFGESLYGAWGTGERPICDAARQPEACPETRKAHFVETLGTSVKQLALNGIVSCALKNDGSVWCWGNNMTRVISDSERVIEEDGEKLNLEPLPKQRAELGFDNRRILAGLGYACVEKNDGSFWCWGGNDGQFGGASVKFIPPTRLELPAPRCKP